MAVKALTLPFQSVLVEKHMPCGVRIGSAKVLSGLVRGILSKSGHDYYGNGSSYHLSQSAIFEASKMADGK